ncbi:MAG: dephospho-CoA kinase [Cellulomonadaceae bacterium]|jgi:dephospho-CoA kinase|nr:dephospho-CoA kinase [Cellulomonadaceae bacterium]
MLRVGLTGGIAAGKTTASERFAALGAVIIDYDELAKAAVAPGSQGLELVVSHFQPRVSQPLLGQAGELDRAALAALIFDDPRARGELEAIIHPIVFQMAAEMEAAAAASDPDVIVIHDIPLLVEADLGNEFEVIISVIAPKELRLQRLIAARGLTKNEAEARIAASAPDFQRAEIADLILNGSGTVELLQAEVDETWELLNLIALRGSTAHADITTAP